MDNYLFIAPGDITQIAADSIAYSTSTNLGRSGNLYPAFARHFPAFASWYSHLLDDVDRPCEVGGTFWMNLCPSTKPHGIVVVAATGGSAKDEDKAAIAVRSAIDTAVARLRGDCRRTGRLLIALPAFRVGMGGDRNHRLRSALAQVGAALDALRRHSQIDVVFVTYTPALYQIFLEARRQLLGAPVLEVEPPPELVESFLAGEGILFVGAGMSRGAGLPDWGELVSRLATELSISSSVGLDSLDVAQWYREHFGATKLAEVIHQTFADPERSGRPTLAHYLLLSLPVRLILTTNYDALLERTLAALKRPAVPIIRQQDVARTGRDEGVYVVKFHGDAATAEEIVLCRDDYDEFFERRPAMARLLEGLLLNRTFFFVGYGLRDPNFRDVYSRIGRIMVGAQRQAFATTFQPPGAHSPYGQRQWKEKQLHLIGIPGTDSDDQHACLLRFLDRLAEQVTVRTPGLFLAPDVNVASPLGKLRKVLIEQVGEEVERAARQDLSGPHAQADLGHLLGVIEFLSKQGWRPGRGRMMGLGDLCEVLAEQATSESQKRRLLGLALTATEAFADTERIGRKLADLCPHSKSSRPLT